MKPVAEKPVLEHDADLVRRIASGDREAFALLIRQHQNQLVNLAFRLLGDHAAAEDIVQDAFLRAYQAASRFRGEAAVQTWLYRITVNLALKHLRKRRWETLFSFLEPEEMNRWRTEKSQSPDQLAEAEERQRLLHQAILNLPESQRTVLVLHRWEGLSHREIASILEVSVSAVESRLHRAYKNLARRLQGMME